MKQAIPTPEVPAAGPYSQAVRAGEWIFVSGQLPLDPETGAVAGDDAGAQARRALDNLEAVLRAAGASIADVVKTTVYLTDLAEFAAVNAVYAERFGEPQPARSTVGVAALPRGVRVEIDAIAYLGGC
jgi:2-iminobutanoate/2-iminopropanoate deaminase